MSQVHYYSILMNITNLDANNSFDSLFASLLANFIIKKFSIDSSYLGILFPIIIPIVSSLKKEFSIHDIVKKFDGMTILILFLFTLIYIFRTKIINFFTRNKDKNYTLISLYDNQYIAIYLKYMKNYPTFFEHNYDINYGNAEYIAEYMFSNNNNIKSSFLERMGEITPSIGTVIHFIDTNLKTKGYIIWDEIEHKVDVSHKKETGTKTMKLKFMKIYLEKATVKSVDSFINKINKYNRKMQKFESILLCYSKVFKEAKNYSFIETVMYNGRKRTLAENEKLYIDSFFHKEKNRLWSYIKNMVEYPEMFYKMGQSPRQNLLLYGPPGSGKSTFAYRIAMTLNRNIVSLDLREISTKKSIFQIFNNNTTPSRTVFILDEFDLTVKHLYHRERLRSEHTRRFYDEGFMYKKHKSSKKIKNDDANDDKDKKDTDNTDLSTINDYDNEFGLKDLLEIFQGSVPIDSMIIIATTNDYEGIKNLCPQLFRAGRLTPVEFGYLDNTSLQDLTKYYFNNKINTKIPDKINVPTSQVIELALESLTHKQNKFEYFQKNLFKLIGYKKVQ